MKTPIYNLLNVDSTTRWTVSWARGLAGAILHSSIPMICKAVRGGGCCRLHLCVSEGFHWRWRKERAVSRKWRTTFGRLVRGSLLDNGAVLLSETFPLLSRGSGRKDPARRPGGSFCFLATFGALRNNLRVGERRSQRNSIPSNQPPSSSGSCYTYIYSPLGLAMGKEQELLDAARTGNLAAVEKLLSGKRQSAGGSSGSAGSGNSSGSSHGASSHPLSSLLR